MLILVKNFVFKEGVDNLKILFIYDEKIFSYEKKIWRLLLIRKIWDSYIVIKMGCL